MSTTPGPPDGRDAARGSKGDPRPPELVIEVVIDVPPEVWIAAAREGCQTSLGRAFESCRSYLIKTAANELPSDLRTKQDVSDLVQETFLEAFIDFDQFSGRTAAELRGWLRTILVNNLRQAVRYYRDAAKRDIGREVPMDLLQSPEGPEGCLLADTSSPSSYAMRKERSEVVRRAIDRLPVPYREALVLRSEENCTFEEMGRRMNCSTVTARNRWLNAIDRLWLELGVSSLAG